MKRKLFLLPGLCSSHLEFPFPPIFQVCSYFNSRRLLLHPVLSYRIQRQIIPGSKGRLEQPSMLYPSTQSRLMQRQPRSPPNDAHQAYRKTFTWTLLLTWHRILSLPVQPSPSWYIDRYHEEIAELASANTLITRLSEESDIFFALSRSIYDGYPVGYLPSLFSPRRNLLVYIYMVLKFTSRWGFYGCVAWKAGKADWWRVREVINPAKEGKLGEVARRAGVDEVVFKRAAKRVLRVWPLLP